MKWRTVAFLILLIATYSAFVTSTPVMAEDGSTPNMPNPTPGTPIAPLDGDPIPGGPGPGGYN